MEHADRSDSEWSITQVAKAVGTTSRTLRHYGQLGLLEPSRIGPNGYRFYGRHALVRLQRILLLRELGLGLGVIAEVLERETNEQRALRDHVRWLEAERDRLGRQLVAVRSTLTALESEEEITMNDMLDGFDHSQYEHEVAERWGADAAKRGSDWWAAQSPDERAAFAREVEALNRAWGDLHAAGADPAGLDARAVAERHVAWLGRVPATPRGHASGEASHEYVLGLADMYVADERFAANYGGTEGAAFVREALRVHLGAGGTAAS
ncbi:MerR family transcriptional regulator [Pseudoclavibacter endophyticus]|uniref:MerR family transcriptional regulator n=1 Tax=Pseudoclavibacter endophyticus TaxID=1778590 RepID=A0A6H9WRS4_9MICO|nr:MerR family transcriptional regulator [Pseudoclavibacter endophyticus]KAB1650321.1 MerR family transcriptional regulator [Pseudoclavibacter endophyticus]GGA55165.1 MerR family transcriptional regulator [Pseudoclavibacter endophyticus]